MNTQTITKKDIFDFVRKINGTLTQKQVIAGDFIIDKLGVDVVYKFLGITNSTVTVTPEILRAIYPSVDVRFTDVINKYAPLFEINTKERMSAYLSQVLLESNGFNTLRENMNYSAKRLLAVFPKYFKTLDQAQKTVAKGQIEIAHVVYGNRLGNVNYGDGYNYRGGGLIHTTGKSNYIELNNELKKYVSGFDVVNKPDTITDVNCAVLASMIFWKSRNINTVADKGDIVAVSKLVNGGTNGLEERKSLYLKAKKALGG